MKNKFCKSIALISIFIMIFSLCGCGSGASGKNVKIDSVLPDCVTYYPVCPKCDHVSSLTMKNLSEGDEQEYKGNHMCEMCFEYYEITLKRN